MRLSLSKHTCVFAIKLALIGQAVRTRSLKLWTTDEVGGQQTKSMEDDGQTPDHSHPISSPCQSNGSGELKMVYYKTTL